MRLKTDSELHQDGEHGACERNIRVITASIGSIFLMTCKIQDYVDEGHSCKSFCYSNWNYSENPSCEITMWHIE